MDNTPRRDKKPLSKIVTASWSVILDLHKSPSSLSLVMLSMVPGTDDDKMQCLGYSAEYTPARPSRTITVGDGHSSGDHARLMIGQK